MINTEILNKRCIEWRPKTLCEKDPNNEDCECDEYSYKEWRHINLTCCKEEHFTYICGENCNQFYIKKDKDSCVKAHLKNECEKGNPEYMVYVQFKNRIEYIQSDKIPENKVKVEWQICRQKTDLEKFKEKLNNYDCEKLALDFTEDCVFNCEHNYYEPDDERLKEYFLLKNCNI